ncbi:MAG: hypothetical protein J5I90_15300 [Caldilineales bacterium]|nr:hypothetical protein [Caldilineales bacterium]
MGYSIRIALLLALVAMLASCGGRDGSVENQNQGADISPVPSQPQSDEEAIAALLVAESEGVLHQDMDLLAGIWLEDSFITDAHHTPDYKDDDATWHGIDAIMDRYVVLVFPGNPQTAKPEIQSLTVQDDSAEAVSSTHIGEEVSPAGDRWGFAKKDGRWYIQSLTYNLEPENR